MSTEIFFKDLQTLKYADESILVQKLIDICKENYKGKKIKISAQKHLQKFYEKCGFVFEGDNYLEDEIPHCAMYYF